MRAGTVVVLAALMLCTAAAFHALGSGHRAYWSAIGGGYLVMLAIALAAGRRWTGAPG